MPPTQNQNPIMNGSQMPPMQVTPERKGGLGPIIGTIIIIVLIVAGGLYFWGSKLNKQTDTVPYIPSDDSQQQQAQPDTSQNDIQSDTAAGLPPQSSSDDPNAIQSDFSAMNTDQMESQNNAEMNNI